MERRTNAEQNGARAMSGARVGQTLGVYELKAFIGAGGMGEVYRGVDTRLGRTVAVKILPSQSAGDDERRQRFKREAKLVSSLNHPHICALYDIGTAEGIDFLVMEHLSGETLAERLRRGPVPCSQALTWLVQIVDALDRAHRQGIVHRDLKPGNVMLTASGAKLLDFGAATLAAPPRGLDTASPARESMALTTEGLIVGTVQYMAPEQIKGGAPDRRSDLFALGIIAYEMIGGRRPFEGGTTAELIGSILRDEPPALAGFVPGAHAAVVQAIERCLAKDAEDRWQTASDLLFYLRAITPDSARQPAPSRRDRAVWLERVVSAAVLVIAVLSTAYWARRPARDDRGAARIPFRFSIAPPDGAFLSGSDVPFAVSPDGRQIAYVASGAGAGRHLWVRSLDSDGQRALPGTDGATTPFWSPDSQWVGFFAARALKKTRVSSGITQLIAPDVVTFGGAAWNANDDIIFPGFRGGISRVSAHGGPVSRVPIEEGVHLSPQFLADGQHFIYAAGLTGAIDLASLSGGHPRTLLRFPVRVSTLGHAPGYVFFVEDATLFAVPLNEQTLEITGPPARLADGIPLSTPARAPFSVSAAGVLAYWTHPLGTPAALRWYDRDGASSPALDRPAQYRGFSLAPDDRQLVFSRIDRSGAADLWLRDLTANTERQITFEGAAFTPQWSPDGGRIAFSAYVQGPPPQLFVRTVAGNGPAVRLGATPLISFASDWSPDGRYIVAVRTQDPVNHHDVWFHRPDGTSERAAFDTNANEWHGKVSRDGRWIAYTTDQSGTEEVAVASFPDGAVRRRITTGGGTLPQWGDEGELLYVSPDGRLTSVEVQSRGGGVDVGPARALFRLANLIEVDPELWPTVNAYTPTRTRGRFLVAEATADPGVPPISVIVNWPALLAR
jgi:serine/threonine protein kinase/Tol biopolymer transport system component